MQLWHQAAAGSFESCEAELSPERSGEMVLGQLHSRCYNGKYHVSRMSAAESELSKKRHVMVACQSFIGMQ